MAGQAAPAADSGEIRLNWRGYDDLPDPEERQILMSSAAAIHRAEGRRRHEIGQALNVAKAAIRHGNWAEWVAEEFGAYGWSERTIRDFMSAGRLVAAVPAAAELAAKPQAILGSAKNADIAADVAEELIQADAAGQGSGRGGRVNEADVKRAINEARGRSVYTDLAPPAPSSVPADKPKSAPPAPKGRETYTGPDDDDAGAEVWDLSNPAGDLAPEIRPADNGAGLVSVSLPYATALALASAARAGDLAGALSFGQVEELISILQGAIDRA